MEVVLQAWTRDEVTFEGEFFQFDEVLTTPKPYQQPRPPVWFGAHSQASFEYAALMNFDVSQNIDTDETVAAKFKSWRQMWDQYGHTGPKPRAFLTRHVHVAETDEKAREEAEPHLLIPRSGSRPSNTADNPELDLIGQTRVGYGMGGRFSGEAGTPEREELIE
jgi:alkanesulfonate monooxygenase SsuD/methylene tetrahydromethanopterin reductase-like flavin-dependent oxidoreductase (luciferase family)